MKLSEAKKLIREYSREELEDAIADHGEEVVNAAVACDVKLDDIREAYQGEFRDDAAFTEYICTETDGGALKALPSYIRIDWEGTARDVMMDYCSDNGHYFRSL